MPEFSHALTRHISRHDSRRHFSYAADDMPQSHCASVHASHADGFATPTRHFAPPSANYSAPTSRAEAREAPTLLADDAGCRYHLPNAVSASSRRQVYASAICHGAVCFCFVRLAMMLCRACFSPLFAAILKQVTAPHSCINRYQMPQQVDGHLISLDTAAAFVALASPLWRVDCPAHEARRSTPRFSCAHAAESRFTVRHVSRYVFHVSDFSSVHDSVSVCRLLPIYAILSGK